VGSAPERIVVGRIVKPHGIQGEVVVEVLSDAPDRFVPRARFDAGDPDGDRTALTVRKVRLDRGRLLVTFAKVASRDAAAALRGKLLSIAGTEAAPPPDGTYYTWQVEGLEAVDEEGRSLGRLVHVVERAGNDIWVIDTGHGEAMVPAVDEFIRSVDLEAGRVVIHVIPGLFDG
jgi:16S rRNA processing protein RimM